MAKKSDKRMSQHTNIALPQLTYNRRDYTALRAYVLKIPLQRIADLYYSEDSPQLTMGLERWLLDMRANLIERAIEHNPAAAQALQHARQGGAITTKALEILIQAADLPTPVPNRTQRISQWFKPKTVEAFKDEAITTLGDLVDLINRRGASWWRSVPRIGAGRAVSVMRFLQEWPDELGEVAVERIHLEPAVTFDLLPVLDPVKMREVAPLGTFQLPAWLAGTDGANRSPAFCFISARNDLEAIQCYLARFAGQMHTLRAYTKELERFVLWCALVACKPMSSLLVDDCEAYKNFLVAPLPEFSGPRTVKTSKRWRPFAEERMSADSQKHALLVLRAAFDWLVKVRYLAGSPWVAVKDPSIVEQVDKMNIERALPVDLWDKVISVLTQRASAPENQQDRVALATILLMGDSGLRRAEAASAQREKLKKSRHGTTVWMLEVLGKRSKIRKVPVSPRTISALRAHWLDRDADFDLQATDLPLVAPIVVPGTARALSKHVDIGRKGYNPNSLYDLIAGALRRVSKHGSALAPEEVTALTPEHLVQLAATSPHAFRHTFGTLAVEKDMPIVVAQEILGHASASTTAIYVKAREKRIAEAAELYYAKQERTGRDG
jgi:site-specific recombinase XerD